MKIDISNIAENKTSRKIEKTNQSYSEIFSDILSGAFGIENMGVLSNIQDNSSLSEELISSLSEDTDISELKPSYKYDCMSIDRDDAIFFAKAIKGENYSFSVNGNVLMENMATNVKEAATVYKSAEVSKTLMNMIENSQSTQKPVRIDFGNDISAVIRVSQDGKISAEFIPSDKVAEEYLKNNISYLEQTFNEENIPYNQLSYREDRSKQRQQNQAQTNQEKQQKENR
jgi:hypothetical protein